MKILNEIVESDKALDEVKSKYIDKPFYDKNFFDLNKDDPDFEENFNRILAFNAE